MIQESLIKRCVKKITDNHDVKITYGKLSTVILVLTISGASLAGLAKLLNTASDIAGTLGTEKCGQIPHENDCVINWCYHGMLKGIYWKYMGVCTHPCTKEVETVFYESRRGAVEHCLQNLMTKISEHEKYKTQDLEEHIKHEENEKHKKYEEHKKHEEI
ncbi:uncharacterized protein LOC123550973 [Mercenaria mercenaria]|uniref:uncharacterized protein LOC123550973 n=1 Tax=Mercenaria mercenaria TaxID=6596 RepID=UPI00234FA371|nr:uncharacterized protein LOC123550973 [Mercenaria mercenaria]